MGFLIVLLLCQVSLNSLEVKEFSGCLKCKGEFSFHGTAVVFEFFGVSEVHVIKFVLVSFTKCNGSGSSVSGDIEAGPNRSSSDTVHLKLTESNSEYLISVNRKVRVGKTRVHSDSELRGVREFFSSSFEETSFNIEVISIKATLVVGVGIGRDNESTFNRHFLISSPLYRNSQL